MKNQYLKLPLRFKQLLEGGQLPQCDLKNSIFRNLHLIITTGTNENKADQKYGVSFWDNDYDIHLSNDARKQIIIDNLKQNISIYEKRLSNVAIHVNVKQAHLRSKENEGLRRRVEISVTGTIVKNLEPVTFQTGFFIGPFTLG